MNSGLSYYEFKRECESWIAAFGPAGNIQRKEFYSTLKTEFARLKYLKFQKAVVTTKDQLMIDVFGEFKVSLRHVDMVKIDFANVWATYVVGEQVGAHFLDTVDPGFVFNYAMRPKDEYCIVGRIQVVAVRQE